MPKTKQLKTGQIVGAEGDSILLAQENIGGGTGGGGVTRSRCDVVIFATGFKTTHAEWLSQSMGAESGGNEFRVGFAHGNALLPLRQIGLEAQSVADKICRKRV